MASDRSPLSKRLRDTLARRTGVPAEEAHDAAAVPSPPAVPVPPPAPAPAPSLFAQPAPETPDDEQPTGDVPVIAEQPTHDAPAIVPPADRAATEPTPPVPPAGPTLSPPVIPAPEPEAAPEPVAEPAPAPSPTSADADDQPEDDDEPFSSKGAIWPQSSPTPRFDPQPVSEPAPTPVDDGPTFPEPSPTPIEDDAPAPSESATAASASLPSEPGSDAPNGHTDVTVEQSAVDAGTGARSGAGGRAGAAFGKLRRLRGGRAEAPAAAPTAPAVATDAGDTAPVPTSAPASAAPAQAAAVAPAPTPASRELPVPPLEPSAKPSFTERATLRRRAKTLRARRDAGLLELGAIVLDQRRFGDPTGGALMRRRTDELADVDSELAAIEQALDDDGPAETVAQLGVVRCLTCTSLVGPRDRFCVHCGAPRPEDTAPPAGTA